MDLRLNRANFPNIEYIAIPREDGNGMAIFRSIEFEQSINGTTINYDGENITYVPSSKSGDTLIIPSQHTLAEAECDKTLSRYKILTIS